MVHQLSLYGTIGHDSFAQTVSTFQALTGMISPQPIAIYTLITKPHNVFKPKWEAGKVNQIDQYYMKCITSWDCDGLSLASIGKPLLADDNLTADKLFEDGIKRVWTLQISDIPLAGKNQACSAQTIYESTLVHHHTGIQMKDEDVKEIKMEEVPDSKDSFLQFLEELGYDVINQFWKKGVQFFYGDIVIEIYKVYIRDNDDTEFRDKIKLKLLDESNAFQMKAYINIAKLTDVELKEQGTAELLKLKETLTFLDFQIPDRMSMDSRITSD